MDISIVIPLYNEEESLPELIFWIDKVFKANNYSGEVVMIDDGSTDKSWGIVTQLKEQYPMIKAIRFGRNYGKSAALHCGFQITEGDVVITMDADLQDSPDEIPELFKMIKEQGFDLVSGWKKKRYDNALTKNLPSKLYNYTSRKFSGTHLHDMNCGLKAYRSEVIKNIEVYGEMHRYIPILAKDAGFKKIGEKVVEHRARKFGVTKFGLERFINGFLDLLTISFVTKFGKKPMHFFGVLGALMFIFGLMIATYLFINKFIKLQIGVKERLITEDSFFYLGIMAMILGCMFFLTGFIGELISRNSSERNKYFIRDEI